MADDLSPEDKKSKDRVTYWLDQISAARKREKSWRKEGQRILKIYDGSKKDAIPFNILYSNTETLAPALYNATPRPVVARRFKDDDPLGKASSVAGQRSLEFLVDTNSEEYASYDDVMGDAVLDALLPGRGASRIRYDADIVGAAPNRYVKSEGLCYESLKWDRWVFGYAKKWSKVPWVAFEHDVELSEAEELFGKEKASKLVFTADEKASSDREDDSDKVEDGDEARKVAKVWELWVRKGKKCIFVSPNSPDVLLKEGEVPLDISGFFPMPEPMRFLHKSNDLMPTPLYSLYENQAKELNRLSVRINRVAEAIKVRGAYNSEISELDQLLKQDDNAMVGATNVAALQEGGLEKAIWLMPIEKLVLVLQQLYIARQNCKQIIYEVTGISDILRGSTVASETATAQQIKSQWGTLRLKRMQREVARYARDMLRISLEIAAKKFQEKTFAGMTGLPYATTQEVRAAQGQVAAARSMIASSGQLTQVPPQQQQQAMQAALQQLVPAATQTLSKPAWSAVLALLKDDTQRQYRIDIETNSTVDVEAAEDQKQMSEVLGAMSQFIQGISPLIQSGSMPFEVAQNMLLSVVRRYRFGSDIEDSIKAMKAPQNPEAGKAEAEKAKLAQEQQVAAEQAKRDQETHQRDIARADAEIKQAAELAFITVNEARELSAIRVNEMRSKQVYAEKLAVLKVQEAEARVAAAKKLADAKPKEGANASA